MAEAVLDQSVLADAFASFERCAFRCERQPSYAVPEERSSVERFASGIDHDPTEEAYFAEGFAMFRRLTSAGRCLERVRIYDEPPTTYQRWLRWLGSWNAEAGEEIHYLNRSTAVAECLVGEEPRDDDFWLFDDEVVVFLRFDSDGKLIAIWRGDDPAAVARAVAWKANALRYVHQASPSPR
jgi:hypothetical protein